LGIDEPFTVSAELYLPNKAPVVASRSFWQRPIIHRYPVLPLQIQTNDTIIVYVKINSYVAHNCNMYLTSTNTLYKTQIIESIVYGILLGCGMLMLLYNFLLFLSIRDPIYIPYLSYMICFITF
jgi:diguanylate cyclase